MVKRSECTVHTAGNGCRRRFASHSQTCRIKCCASQISTIDTLCTFSVWTEILFLFAWTPALFLRKNCKYIRQPNTFSLHEKYSFQPKIYTRKYINSKFTIHECFDEHSRCKQKPCQIWNIFRWNFCMAKCEIWSMEFLWFSSLSICFRFYSPIYSGWVGIR